MATIVTCVTVTGQDCDGADVSTEELVLPKYEPLYRSVLHYHTITLLHYHIITLLYHSTITLLHYYTIPLLL